MIARAWIVICDGDGCHETVQFPCECDRPSRGDPDKEPLGGHVAERVTLDVESVEHDLHKLRWTEGRDGRWYCPRCAVA